MYLTYTNNVIFKISNTLSFHINKSEKSPKLQSTVNYFVSKKIVNQFIMKKGELITKWSPLKFDKNVHYFVNNLIRLLVFPTRYYLNEKLD